MPIDYSLLKFSKGRVKSLLVDDARKARVSVDDRESAKVKVRSTGQCEIVERRKPRCIKKAIHVHHMIGGIGVRGRGESAKAIRKQHACPDHHELITAKKLVRIGRALPHFKDEYRRVK